MPATFKTVTHRNVGSKTQKLGQHAQQLFEITADGTLTALSIKPRLRRIVTVEVLDNTTNPITWTVTNGVQPVIAASVPAAIVTGTKRIVRVLGHYAG